MQRSLCKAACHSVCVSLGEQTIDQTIKHNHLGRGDERGCRVGGSVEASHCCTVLGGQISGRQETEERKDFEKCGFPKVTCAERSYCSLASHYLCLHGCQFHYNLMNGVKPELCFPAGLRRSKALPKILSTKMSFDIVCRLHYVSRHTRRPMLLMLRWIRNVNVYVKRKGKFALRKGIGLDTIPSSAYKAPHDGNFTTVPERLFLN